MTAFHTSIITAATIGLAGCMLSPTDDGRVTSATTSLPFEGFVPVPDWPVQIRAWDYNAGTMANVGAPVMPSTSAMQLSDGPVYFWTAPQVLPSQFWRTGPGGGQCAAVGAQAAGSDVITVESSWGSCFDANPTINGFYQNCRSNHSPVAMIYTNSWGAVTVDQTRLDVAGAIASSQITLVLDNYQPTAGWNCNSHDPAGCPPGLSADPELYKFYEPDASWLSQSGQPTLSFSITPTRSDPLTAYIDNMVSQSIDFTTSGNRFVLGINFESNGPEIQLDCIGNLFCFLYPSTLAIDTPRAAISFALDVQNGQVVYTDAVATFTTSSTSDDAKSAANGIAAAMTDKINNEPSIKRAIAGALDAVIRQTANLGAFPLESVSIGGGTVHVRPGCVLD